MSSGRCGLGLMPHTRARIRVRTMIVTIHDGTRRAGSLQAVDLLPLALWFGVFAAVTGICRRHNARLYMERFVQMGLVSTDARASWRPDALATLKQWLGESAKDWMVEGGGLAVNCRHIESEVRVWGCRGGGRRCAFVCRRRARGLTAAQLRKLGDYRGTVSDWDECAPNPNEVTSPLTFGVLS